MTYTTRFVWHEMMTADIEKTKAFYGEVFGWKFKDMNMAGMNYPMIYVGENSIGGLMQMSAQQQANMPPHWIGHIGTDNLANVLEATKANGGNIASGPNEVPNMGSFAVIGDPQGAWFAAWQPANPTNNMPTPKASEFCWDSLNTTDIAGASNFYAKLFNWTAVGGPVSGGSVYKSGDVMIADVSPTPPGMKTANWHAHVLVDSIADTQGRATRMGGKILLEKMEVPGMGYVSMIQDTQGAVIGIFEGLKK